MKDYYLCCDQCQKPILKIIDSSQVIQLQEYTLLCKKCKAKKQKKAESNIL